MKRGIALLLLWSLTAFVLGSGCIAAIPPGGVAWPYYFFVGSLPAGAFLYARYDRRVSVVVCYGLLAGALFAWPIFGNDRALVLGITPPHRAIFLSALFSLLMAVLCTAAYAVGRRRLTVS